MAAMALGFTSCNQEDEPKFHVPTTFNISTPAMQNIAFLCGTDMTDKATFNLFCTQPNYGYSAICNYSALVSLDPEAPEEEWIALPNENPTQAAMAIKTYELGVAINKLLGITSADEFAAWRSVDGKTAAETAFKCYFKAVCEIPGIANSRIVSTNAPVSYNKVYIQFAEKKPGWIFILGNVSDKDGNNPNGFTSPSASNYDAYKAHWALYEPDDMVGEKIYVGQFMLDPKDGAIDLSNPDTASQFRFAYELLGWTGGDGFLGSNKADFYCLPITDTFDSLYKGGIINNGLGNWGVHVEQQTPMTVVVDQSDLKIYVKEGFHDVTFNGRTPNFE